MKDFTNALKDSGNLCIEDKMTESMEFKEFTQNICSEVERELGEDFRVEVREIKKNNGIVLQGLMIAPETDGVQNVVPTIYLNDLFKAYRSGMDFEAVIKKLLTVYWENAPKCIDMEFFRSFEKVKSRICFRLIGKARNEELLEDVPHMEFLDLAICFYYAYQGEPLREGTILIHNSHMEMWGTCVEELYALAQENTPSLFPWECSSLDEILKGLTGWDICEEDGDSKNSSFRDIPMRVLSNQKRLHGASCVLYPGLLEELALMRQRNLYILPSSLHEVILLEDTGREDEEELRQMIAFVNATEVAPVEVLSDSLYYYDIEEKRVRIIAA